MIADLYIYIYAPSLKTYDSNPDLTTFYIMLTKFLSLFITIFLFLFIYMGDMVVSDNKQKYIIIILYVLVVLLSIGIVWTMILAIEGISSTSTLRENAFLVYVLTYIVTLGFLIITIATFIFLTISFSIKLKMSSEAYAKEHERYMTGHEHKAMSSSSGQLKHQSPLPQKETSGQGQASDLIQSSPAPKV
jgi:type III secretory pathway component EscU